MISHDDKPSGTVALNWMNRAGGQLLSAQGLSSFLLCCYQPAFSSFLFHGLQFAQIAVFDITCKHKNKQVWEHAVCGVQPWEDTGLRILRRKKLFLFVFLSWSPSAGLLPHDSLAEVGPHAPAHISNCKGTVLPCAPRLECEATTSAVWASGKMSVDQENRVGSWWAASSASHLCCAEGAEGRWDVGGMAAGIKTSHLPSVLREQRVGGCRLLESKPLSTLLPSDSRHTWFCLNLEPVCNHVLLGT